MSYYDNRDALVKIAMELQDKGWKIFGFREDDSDMMTDYYSPASWSVGLATKNGYVLVVDNHSNSRSGYEVKKYNHNKTSYKASDRIIKLEAMMKDPASTENEKASCAVLIEKEKEKQGIAPTYTIEEVYPTFAHGNPKSSNWHVEKDGVILAKGNGAFAVNNYDWENKEVSAADQKAEKLKKFINKIEKVLTDSDALKAEVVKVPVTVIKEVELNVASITDADIKEGFTFVYKVSYTNGNHKGTKYTYVKKHDGNNGSWYTFAKLGKNNKPSKAMGNSMMPDLKRLNEILAKGHIAIIEFKEVTEYVEKTVFKKTKRTVKASDSVQIESNEMVAEQPTEQPEQATEAAQAETVSNDTANEDRATKRQLWALHCATKLNTTNLVISKKRAFELIMKSANGKSILEELNAMLNGETVEESKPEQNEPEATEEPENTHNSDSASEQQDNVIYHSFNNNNITEQEENKIMTTLIFEGAGMDSAESSIVSGVGNCRIRTRIRNNEGRVIYLEMSGFIHSGNNKPQFAKGFSVVGHVSHCFYADSVWDSNRSCSENLSIKERGHFEYSKENILKWVNDNLNCSFDNMEVINDNSVRVHDTKDPLCDCSKGEYEPYKDIEININVLDRVEPIQAFPKNRLVQYEISYDYVIKHKHLKEWIEERQQKEQEQFKSYNFYVSLRYDIDGIIRSAELTSRQNFCNMGLGLESLVTVVNEILNINQKRQDQKQSALV